MTTSSPGSGRLPEWSLLTHRITEVRVRAEHEETSGRHRILSSVCVAHGTAGPLAVAWVRPRAHGPVHVLLGGAHAVEDAETAEGKVSFPPGARGRSQSADEVRGALGGLEWQRGQLALNALGVVEDSPLDRIEDIFAVGDAPLGFAVFARPVATAETDEAINRLSDEIARTEALRSGRGIHRRQLARAEQNLEYLDRSVGIGCWELELWTGGAGPGDAAVVAALVAGSRDVAEVPLLVCGQGATPGPALWSPQVVVGSDVVAALARPPFRELPGVRVTTLPEFDQNVEDRVEIRLGAVLDGGGSPAAPFGVSMDSINRHVFVSGATGAGKSETVRSLLKGLDRRRVPWLVVEPAKAEYVELAPWLDPATPLVVIRPGDPDVPPPMLNPLEPSSIVVDGARVTFPLQTHLDMVRALFVASFDADEPFPQILDAGLARSYEERGWDLVTSLPRDPTLTPPEWPVLGDVVRESLAVVERLGYASDVRNNVRGFIRVRVESLRSGTPGRFFEGGYPLDLDDLLARPTVLEIEDVGDDRDKAFLIGTLVIRIVEHLRLRHQHGLQPAGLGHVLVIEEAHRLLRRVAEEHPSAHAVTMFANLLAEVRAYGEGVVVAEQIPAKIIPDLVKNSAVKLMHRLPAEDDRRAVGATMNLSNEQSRHVVSLEPGVVVAHAAGMDRPVLARIDRVAGHERTGGGTARPTVGARSGAGREPTPEDRLTLGELAAARALVGPQVALWAEQVMVCHLTNDPVGTPVGPWTTALRRADGRLRACAIRFAVSDAVSRRRPLVRAWHDPAELAEALVALMDAQISPSGGPEEPRWRWSIGQYRYRRVGRALLDRTGDDDRAVPHPKTSTWATRGIHLPGPSWAEQAEQLRALEGSGPLVRKHELAGSPPVMDQLAQAMGELGGDEATRISYALTDLGLQARQVVVRIGAHRG